MIKTRFSDRSKSRQQGAILLSAIIVTFVISMLAGSYLYLSSGEYRMSHRTFNRGASFALAEGGIDYAIHALNSNHSTGWTVSGDTWERALYDFLVSEGTVGHVKMKILGASSRTPVIYSEGTVLISNGPPVSRQIKVQLESSSSGGKLNTSLIYAKAIDAAGNNILAAMYNSKNGVEGAVYYDLETRSWRRNYDDSLRLVVDTITTDTLGNMDVFGWVVTREGGAIDFNSKGGTFKYNSFFDLDRGIATTDRVTDDFYGSFEPIVAPDNLGNVSRTSPVFVAAEGGGNGVKTATMDGTSNYIFSGEDEVLSVANGDALNITGDVIIVVDNEGTINIKGDLNIQPGASLKIYTDGDFIVTGDVNNSNVAENFQLYGMNTTENEQLFKLHGNSRMTAFIYAPRASGELKGGGNEGEFEGAILMDEIKITGNYFFLCDAALGAVDGLINVGGNHLVNEWLELDDRTAQTAKYSM